MNCRPSFCSKQTYVRLFSYFGRRMPHNILGTLESIGWKLKMLHTGCTIDNSEYRVATSFSTFSLTLWLRKTLTAQKVEHTFVLAKSSHMRVSLRRKLFKKFKLVMGVSISIKRSRSFLQEKPALSACSSVRSTSRRRLST